MEFTYEVCRDYGHSYLLQGINIFRSPYQGQVEEETHSDHLSAWNQPLKKKFPDYIDKEDYEEQM